MLGTTRLTWTWSAFACWECDEQTQERWRNEDALALALCLAVLCCAALRWCVCGSRVNSTLSLCTVLLIKLEVHRWQEVCKCIACVSIGMCAYVQYMLWEPLCLNGDTVWVHLCPAVQYPCMLVTAFRGLSKIRSTLLDGPYEMIYGCSSYLPSFTDAVPHPYTQYT